jgi:hypothetical protein
LLWNFFIVDVEFASCRWFNCLQTFDHSIRSLDSLPSLNMLVCWPMLVLWH